MNNNSQVITNELLLALLNQLYSIELMLADVYIGKANLRYSNQMLNNDQKVLDMLTELVKGDIKESVKE